MALERKQTKMKYVQFSSCIILCDYVGNDLPQEEMPSQSLNHMDEMEKRSQVYVYQALQINYAICLTN